MPNYDLVCSNCGNSWEIYLSYNDYSKIGKSLPCPCCKKRKSVSVSIENIEVRTFVYQEPKTVGHQMHRNTERMGKYELESKRALDKQKESENKQKRRQALKDSGVLPKGSKLVETVKLTKPWFGELPKEKAKKIFSGTPKEQAEKVQKYIEKGE